MNKLLRAWQTFHWTYTKDMPKCSQLFTSRILMYPYFKNRILMYHNEFYHPIN